MRVFRSLVFLVIAAVLLGVLYYVGMFGLRLNNTTMLARDSAAFQVLNPEARLAVLVVGDSTAVGTGAVLPSASVAGRIAQQFPCTNLVNRARDGALMRDLAAQIDGTGDTPFNLLLMQVGATDAVSFTDLPDLRRGLDEALSRGTAKARHVVVLGSSSLAAAPMFMPPFDAIFSRRAHGVERVLRDASEEAGVEYVDVSKSPASVALSSDPARYYASDYLHPNSDGYGLWFKAMSKQVQLGSILQC
jgi:lysophospholipase L1-like esterase